jgi:hypothetical protein
MNKDINVLKLFGGKRKNGHKSNCACHICENMKNKAKRGGYQVELDKEKEKMTGGSRKKNGHRRDCKCPICKNMSRSKNMSRFKKRGGGSDDNSSSSSDDSSSEDDSSSSEDNSISPEDDTNSNSLDTKIGGRKKRGNGHKPNCKCPICKNMRKGKKGGDPNNIPNDIPDIENQRGDIEEAGIKSSNSSNLSPGSETPASSSEYDALDDAERGEAGPNIVGGTRKRRVHKKKSRKSRKSRKVRRSRRRRH